MSPSKLKNRNDYSGEENDYQKPHGSQLKPTAANSSSNTSSQSQLQGQYRLMIAGRGQVIGWEDVMRRRHATTSMQCVSATGTLIQIAPEVFMASLRRDGALH